MLLSDPIQGIVSIPRSREENQERAFVAASRRKDRTLDARVGSANQASMLHKKRTGRAFKITKETVKKEDMYEEVDELYQEKRIRMLKTLGLQVEEQLRCNLLASFVAYANSHSNEYFIPKWRENKVNPSSSIEPASRKTNLDLSNIGCSSSHGLNLLPSWTGAGNDLLSSPRASFDPNALSYTACMNASEVLFSNPISIPTATSSGRSSAYVAHQKSTPAATKQQQIPTPSKTPSGNYVGQMWQHQTMEQAPIASNAAMQVQKFRDDLSSSPELPLQHQVLPILSGCILSPTGHRTSRGYSGGPSKPKDDFDLHPLTQDTHVAQIPLTLGASWPKAPETKSIKTTDFCLTPNTPLSWTTALKMGGDVIMVSHEVVDPDFTEFSEFALRLGNLFPPLLDLD